MAQNGIEQFTTTLDKVAGAVVYPNPVDLRVARTADIDLTQLTETGQVGFISGVYVDNSDGDFPIYLTATSTGHRIIFPAKSFGYLPIFTANPPRFTVDTGGVIGSFVKFHFHNSPIVPFLGYVA